MANDTQPQSDDPLLEQLSAYLDGELGAEQSREVERLLARDERARGELQRLERAWTLLDQLPRAELSGDFIQSTVEMIAVQEAEAWEAPVERSPVMPWLARIGGAAALVLAACFGYLAVQHALDRDNQRLLADLPVIERMDALRQIDDVELLRQLHTSGLLTPATNEPEPTRQAPAAPRAESLSARQAQIAQLSPDAQQQLLAKYERFGNLPPAEKARLREVQRAIDRDAAREVLLETLDRYHEWLQTLSAAQRAELNALAGDARLARIRELRTVRKPSGMPFYRPLSPEDREVVRAWVERQAVQNMPVERRDELAKLPVDERRRILARQFIQRFQPFEPNRRPTTNWLGEFKSLLDQLSEPARNEFTAAEAGQKLALLTGWLMQSFGMSLGEEQLRQFFQGLTASEQQRLLALPSDEMQRELRRMYFRGSGREFGNGPPRFDGVGRPTQGKDGAFPPGQRGPFKKGGT